MFLGKMLCGEAFGVRGFCSYTTANVSVPVVNATHICIPDRNDSSPQRILDC